MSRRVRQRKQMMIQRILILFMNTSTVSKLNPKATKDPDLEAEDPDLVRNVQDPGSEDQDPEIVIVDQGTKISKMKLTT